MVDESTSEEPRGDLMQRCADTSSSSHEPPMEPRAYVEPGSGKHSVFTNFPKDLNWEICLNTKITRASCRRRADAVIPRAEIFGDCGIAEREVRRIKECTSLVLLQSGLDNEWWADSWNVIAICENILDKLSDGKTQYERWFGMPLDGPVIPFGAMVEYHPISAKDISRLHQFGAKVLPGIFLG